MATKCPSLNLPDAHLDVNSDRACVSVPKAVRQIWVMLRQSPAGPGDEQKTPAGISRSVGYACLKPVRPRAAISSFGRPDRGPEALLIYPGPFLWLEGPGEATLAIRTSMALGCPCLIPIGGSGSGKSSQCNSNDWESQLRRRRCAQNRNPSPHPGIYADNRGQERAEEDHRRGFPPPLILRLWQETSVHAAQTSAMTHKDRRLDFIVTPRIITGQKRA